MSGFVNRNVAGMDGYTPGEQPADRSLVKLNTNENPYPPSPAVREALARFLTDDLRLYPDPFCGALRRVIAGLHGCGVENVFCGNGSDEILSLATRAFVEDDGSIGYLEPSYSLYPVLARIRNVEARPVQLGDRFEWRMPSGYQCSLFLLCNPNAPTGLLHPRSEVLGFCRALRGVVIIDEAYVDFASANCMDLALTEPNVIAMRTLSKAYSLAGLRVGYAVGPAPLVAALFKIKDSYNVDRLAQALAAAAISDQAHMRGNAARIMATRSRLSTALAALGFEVWPSEANFLWTRPPLRSAVEWLERLRARRVLVRHFSGPRTNPYLRITVGSDEQADVLLEACRVILRETGS